MRCVIMCICVLACLGIATSAPADVPTEMSVQGRLTNAAGNPVPAGLKLFTFKIYDQPVGGVEIWPGGPGETLTLATDANGLWNAGVGSLIPLTEAVFLSPVRWLEVTVDDGVNPAETLPRIELRTNPYTYRAATSQQADSLGGLSLSDLVDQFVDVPGDTMTGQLHNRWTAENVGANLDVENVNDSHSGYWNSFDGTWGLQVDAMSDDNYWNIGVASAAIGDNNSIEANRGVYAVAGGTGSVNIGVHSATQMNGTSNYSGYFESGDFVISSPATPGTGGVLLPPNAIDDAEILNEPGIAAAQSTAYTTLACGVNTDLLSVSVSIPGPGYIVVDAKCMSEAASSSGGIVGGGVAVDEIGGVPLVSPYRSLFQVQLPSGGTYLVDMPVSTYRIYYKSAAGTYTFHLNGTKYGNCPVGFSSIVWDCMMRATYYSTSYGSVATLASAEEAGEFNGSEQVSVSTGPEPDAPMVTMYQVDLRELELKAARTAAEAEKARRELMEAKLTAIRSQVQVSEGKRGESKP